MLTLPLAIKFFIACGRGRRLCHSFLECLLASWMQGEKKLGIVSLAFIAFQDAQDRMMIDTPSVGLTRKYGSNVPNHSQHGRMGITYTCQTSATKFTLEMK